jgi:hypothetical protein
LDRGTADHVVERENVSMHGGIVFGGAGDGLGVPPRWRRAHEPVVRPKLAVDATLRAADDQ